MLLLATIAGGIYLSFNLAIVEEYGIEPLRQLLTEGALVWVTDASQWLHDLVTGLNMKVLLSGGAAVGVIVLSIWRLMWRLRSSARFTGTECPHCGYPLSRIRRTDFQRKVSKIIPIRRFYCKKCKWKGLRLKENHPKPLDVQTSSVKPKAPDKIDLG
ncbi:MAG: hypothetical protein ACQETE_06935 [Bacteroidota bacterium]